MTPQGIHGGSSLILEEWTLWKIQLEQLMKTCSPGEGVMLEKFMLCTLPWEGPHVGKVKTVRREWQRGCMMN